MKNLGNGYTLFWSGEEHLKRNGVALIISENIKRKILEVTPVSGRILKISILIDGKAMEIIQIYAPQSGCEEEEKAQFFKMLEDTLHSSNIIMLGDFNAQVGYNRLGYEDILGSHGSGRRNEEGRNLLDFCKRNNFIIGNSWFQKQESHKYTRYSWNNEHKTIIDYIMCTKLIQNKLTNVKVIPSVNFDSDHRLLVGDFKKIQDRKFAIRKLSKIKDWKLEDEVKEMFSNMIKKEEIGMIETEWKQFEDSLVKSAGACGRNTMVEYKNSRSNQKEK